MARLGLAAERPKLRFGLPRLHRRSERIGGARSPYISDAERERARWMTPAELITLIAEHDGCNRSAAWKQICDALSDRKVHIKWEKEPLRLSPYIVYVHRPPEGANFWQQADIDDDGKVFDPETDNRRTLLILKDDIFNNDIFQLGPQPSAKLGGPQSAYDEVKQTYYRLLPRVKPWHRRRSRN